MLEHPLDRIPEGGLRRWQIPSVAIAATCLISLRVVLPPREAHTVVDLVESGTVQTAAAILEHWNHEDRIRLAYAVGLDFLMNPAYMNVLAISCVWAGRAFAGTPVRATASVLAWLCWSVVLTNAAENAGLFLALVSGPTAPWPAVMASAHYWAGFVVALAVAFAIAGAVRRAA